MQVAVEHNLWTISFQPAKNSYIKRVKANISLAYDKRFQESDYNQYFSTFFTKNGQTASICFSVKDPKQQTATLSLNALF